MDFIQAWIVPPEATASAWVYIPTAIAALMITAISKGGFGGGVGILSIPLMLQVAGVWFVLGLWLPVLIACDLATIRNYPKEWNPRAFGHLAPGMLVGIAVATFFLDGANPKNSTAESKQLDAWMKLTVAAISVVFVAIQLRPVREQKEAWQPTWAVSLPVGIMAGLTTMVAHAAGPIITMFMLPQRMEKRVFVGTTGRFFFIFNSLKVPFMWWIQLVTLSTLKYGLWLMLLGPLGVWLGSWLNKHLSALWFVRAVYLSLVVATAKMVYDAVAFLRA